MKGKHIIVLTAPNKTETWGSLKRACDNHPEFKYHTIKSLQFPFSHEGYMFEKVPFNVLSK